MQADIVKNQLLQLIAEINSSLGSDKLQFHQQKVEKKHMSISGGNGRMCVSPSSEGYDVSLSGMSVEKELYPNMQAIFGKAHDGYKQSGSQPFWRTDKFSLVKEAVESYSKSKR